MGASAPHNHMSSVANSDIDIASRGLILIGANPITSFSADSTEALVADNIMKTLYAQHCVQHAGVLRLIKRS